MGWKVLFAFIPPVEWGGGWPAFFVALIFIGLITAIVAEVAMRRPRRSEGLTTLTELEFEDLRRINLV